MSVGFGFSLPAATWNGGSALSSDPSLYMDYTVGSSDVPGVQPGYYLVDDVSGNLTQTTFSSLITFSRASNATRFSPTGQLQYAPHNLLLQSQTLDNATWSKSGVTVTANAGVAPDGTTTADKVIPTAVSSQFKQLQQNITVVAGTTYTFSGFYKADGYNFVQLIGTSASFGTFSVNFDLSNGTETDFAAGTSTVVARFIENYGNGWYRIGVSVICLGSSSSARLIDNIIPASNSVRGVTWTGDGTSGVLTWGLQIAVGPNALDYTPTTTAVVYGPRFDYDPTTLEAKGLLIEEQRTNILLYSEQFDNAYWTKNASTVTANAVTAPDGTLTGYKIIADITNANHTVFRSISFTSGTVYTVSCYAKAGEYDYFTLSAGSTATWPARVTFNLISGTVASTVAGTGSIQNIGNGWYRCSVSATATATAATGVNFAVSSTGSYVAYTGDGTSGIYIWGAQLEAGAFATSYIPTTTAATTRSADIASIGTLSPWYNATEGTLYAEAANIPSSYISGVLMDIGSGGAFLTSAYVSWIGTGWQLAPNGGSLNLNSSVVATLPSKVAAGLAANNSVIAANGALGSVDTSCALPVGATILSIGKAGWSVGNFLNGYIRRITYTPRRLTNAELQSLTS